MTSDEVTRLPDGTYRHSITFEPVDWSKVTLAFEPLAAWANEVSMQLGAISARPLMRELKLRGFIPREQPPQYAYRQTRYGRVPRLTP